MDPLKKLQDIGSAPLSTAVVDLPDDPAPPELRRFLEEKNGFYAFENALLVRSVGGPGPQRDLGAWNAPALWRDEFDDAARGGVFFAEDVFGNQFWLKDGRVLSFNPETGEQEHVALTLDEWARVILSDYVYWTGHPIAVEWQSQYGPLARGTRLIAVTPFVLGGGYGVDNVRPRDEAEGMRFRASLARQIRDLPEGAEIALKVVE